MRLLIVSAPFKQRFFEEMLKFMTVDAQIILLNEFYDKHGLRLPMKLPWKKICAFEPDTVLTDCFHYPQLYSNLYKKLKKKNMRIFTHLRGNLWIETDFYFKNLLRRKFWVDNKYKSDWLYKIIEIPAYYLHYIFLANRAIRMSDMVLPVCRWLEDEIHRRIPGMKTEVMYQGVNPDIFYPDKPHEWEHPSVAIIQNHSIYLKTKGLIDFHGVIERLPHVHFYIAGGESWGGGYFRFVREALGKYENVHFIGNVPHPEGVRRALSACDIYAIPSGLDCCPYTVLEASLCEKPVLGSRIGGIPELIREGETGWTIPNENVDEWVDRISLLLEDEALSRKMGKEGRKFVAEKFSWKVIARQLETILKS
jgi:glycosyltransferase involved in cell wall biosynthesis